MTEQPEYFAHSANDHGVKHKLAEHLRSVGQLAGSFAGNCRWKDEAVLAGLHHDLGKYGDLFQARLRGEEVGLDHWSAGANVTLLKFRAVAAARLVANKGYAAAASPLSNGGRKLNCSRSENALQPKHRIISASDCYISNAVRRWRVGLMTCVHQK